MFWKDRELVTIGDLMDYGIDQCRTKEEAREFMRTYFSENPHAYSNIGYLAGYYSDEKAQQIYDWFETAHPIFGTRRPTFEEALNAGLKMGEVLKKSNNYIDIHDITGYQDV